jgi:c-di-GMP-binding flagellar brake protein YcgR
MDMNRRQFPRFKKTLLIIIHRPYNERRTETAEISIGGTTIHNAQRYYDTEQVLYIEIILEEEGSIFCNARVVSIYPHSKDSPTYKVNLQFIDMPDADKEKLKNYIERD